jgi:hypothetical protein
MTPHDEDSEMNSDELDAYLGIALFHYVWPDSKRVSQYERRTSLCLAKNFDEAKAQFLAAWAKNGSGVEFLEEYWHVEPVEGLRMPAGSIAVIEIDYYMFVSDQPVDEFAREHWSRSAIRDCRAVGRTCVEYRVDGERWGCYNCNRDPEPR